MKNNSKSHYALQLSSNNKTFTLPVSANSTGHAQAQAADICRATSADMFELIYGDHDQTPLSILFAKLALNDFTSTDCFAWSGKFTYSAPCVYMFGKRHYVKNLILKYLDIPKDDVIVKTTCGCKSCINPYHFSYNHKSKRNQKLSIGDEQLLLAFQSQGVTVSQIAKALKVHRSTIYRKLNEHLHSGAISHSDCTA